MTKKEKRELIEFLVSEARKLSFKVEQTELYCEERMKKDPDDPWSINMRIGLNRDKTRLADYERFIEKLSKELRELRA